LIDLNIEKIILITHKERKINARTMRGREKERVEKGIIEIDKKKKNKGWGDIGCS